MKVTITFDVDGCANCPYSDYNKKQNFVGFMCSHPSIKEILPCTFYNIPEKCPLLEKKENEK